MILHLKSGTTTLISPDSGYSFLEVSTTEFADVVRRLIIAAHMDALTPPERFLLFMLKDCGLRDELLAAQPSLKEMR